MQFVVQIGMGTKAPAEKMDFYEKTCGKCDFFRLMFGNESPGFWFGGGKRVQKSRAVPSYASIAEEK